MLGNLPACIITARSQFNCSESLCDLFGRQIHMRNFERSSTLGIFLRRIRSTGVIDCNNVRDGQPRIVQADVSILLISNVRYVYFPRKNVCVAPECSTGYYGIYSIMCCTIEL